MECKMQIVTGVESKSNLLYLYNVHMHRGKEESQGNPEGYIFLCFSLDMYMEYGPYVLYSLV